MRAAALACLGMALLSLLLPSQPSYDPWAWLVWGRELSGLGLDTGGGPTWKPLPVGVTTALAPLGALDPDAPPALWLVVVRFAGLLALVLAFRVAQRLCGAGRAGLAAGALAAGTLLVSPSWLRYAAHGNEAPLAAALLLGALDRHLSGKRCPALLLGAMLALVRPEAFVFLGLYAAWLWRSEPALRLPAVCALGVVPALWLAPEWAASGDALDGGRQAASAPPWTLAAQDQPWLAAIERAHRLAGPVVELGVALALAVGLRRRRSPAAGGAALAAAALAWLALVVAMTQAGFSGDARYFTPALVLGCVAAAVGAVGCVRSAPAGRPRAAAVLASAALLAALLPAGASRLERQGREVEQRAALHADLERAVERIGGAVAVRRSGPPAVNRVFETHLAWSLRVPLGDAERGRGRLAFAAHGPASGPRLRSSRRRLLARAGGWSVLAR